MQKVAYLFFCKDNANRRQYNINSFIFIVEVPLILFKDNANHLSHHDVCRCLMLPVSLAAR